MASETAGTRVGSGVRDDAETAAMYWLQERHLDVVREIIEFSSNPAYVAAYVMSQCRRERYAERCAERFVRWLADGMPLPEES
jgi:alpha/beta superfamily hydrolase